MSRVEGRIPNLYNGISQQAPSLRSPSQGELSENAYPTIASGLGKRPPTEHVAKLGDEQLDTAFVTTLNRDKSERYTLFIAEGVIKVYDLLTGAAKTVNGPYDTSYLADASADDITVITVADYSFVVNKKKIVQMTQELFGRMYDGVEVSSIVKFPAAAAFDYKVDTPFGLGTSVGIQWTHVAGTNGRLTFVVPNGTPGFYPGGKFRLTSVVRADSSKIYQLLGYDLTVTSTAVTGAVSSRSLAIVASSPLFLAQGNATNQILGTGFITPYSAQVTTSVAHTLTTSSFVRVEGATPEEYNSTAPVVAVPSTTTFVYDTRTLEALPNATGSFRYSVVQGFKGTKQKFSDLPTSGQVDGDMWKIQGDPQSQRSTFYVMWNSSSGVWVECADPTASVAFDPTTMPHQLVREADGTFTFSSVQWEKRLVGDDVSIPIPSFVGRTISDVLFFRNRLGFLSDESIILSRSGRYFNFWGETVTSVLDSDPIDTSAAHTKVSLLNFAIPFNKTLMLYSDQSQFQLGAGEVLTPKTAKLEPVTEFESSAIARPVAAGQNVFFTLDKTTYATVREYYVDSNSYTNDAADVTAHVPQYLPGNVFKMATSSGEDVLLVASRNEPNALYVYKYYWGSEEKLQSAWNKFVFGPQDKILSFDILNTVVSLVIQREDGVYLERMDVELGRTDTGFSHTVYLDRKVFLQGTYDVNRDVTTWALPYQEEDLQVFTWADFGEGGTILTTSRPTLSTVEVDGDYSAHPCFIGRPYTLRYRFSEQFLRDQENLSVIPGRLQLRQFTVSFHNTGYFRAEVTPKARQKYIYPYTGRVIGDDDFRLGMETIGSGKLSFPVQCRSTDVTIELINDSPLPSFFQSATWKGEYSSTTRR